MIKHHNFFKVHLPKRDYKGETEDELGEIIMEEFHLFSNGEWTKNYDSINPKKDRFEVSLYPSIVYASNKLGHSETEKFQSINSFLDHAFVDFLTRFNPLYKSTKFIEYHLHFYQGDEVDFINHIKYEIISIIKKRKEKNKEKFDYENLETIVTDWVRLKMEKDKNFETQINNAQNVIVNNGSKIKNQGNSIENIPKDKIAKYSLWATLVAIVISVIIGWKEILEFFN